jgi:taurine dioxygenase
MDLELDVLTPIIGAEIRGICISEDLTDDDVQSIHSALLKHHVVFFRDQQLTPGQQSAFARRFGRLRRAQKASFGVVDDAPGVSVLLNDEARAPNVNHYHSDGIFRAQPEFAAMLYGEEVPASGGDTIFVNMAAAYDGLSSELKAYVEAKHAVNDFMKLHGSPAKARSWKGDSAKGMERAREQNPPVAHPMVRTHPVTQCKSLLISESFTSHIDGVSKLESDGILDALFRHCALPEFQCRFRWRKGSLAFWDNRSTMHYAVADYWPARRLMHRVTVETDEVGAPGIEGLAQAVA